MKKFIGLMIMMLFIVSVCEAGQVIMNVWDGSEYGVIEKLYNEGKLPNLKSVGTLKHLWSNEDCFGRIIPTCQLDCMLSMTKPQHATMLTGVLANEHGVYANRDGCYQEIPAGLTVYQKITNIDPTTLTAHVTAKPEMIGEVMFGELVGVIDYFHSSNSTPRAITLEVKNLINLWKNDNFFIFAHFGKPDGVGHKSGVDSLAYEKAIIENDTQLGNIIRQLKNKGIYNNTEIYVLSDHGFGCPTPLQHGCSPHTFIVSTDSGIPSGIFMKDVVGYVLLNYREVGLRIFTEPVIE